MQAAVQTVQAITHVHTAGNSSGIADGGAAVLVASHDYARAHGLRARARIRAMATVGSDPVLMLTAPTPASQLALSRAGLSVSDVDLWEINEAFATVPLRTIRDLGIHPDRVNVNGGAIALGHPLGASGAMLLGTVLDELRAARSSHRCGDTVHRRWPGHCGCGGTGLIATPSIAHHAACGTIHDEASFNEGAGIPAPSIAFTSLVVLLPFVVDQACLRRTISRSAAAPVANNSTDDGSGTTLLVKFALKRACSAGSPV